MSKEPDRISSERAEDEHTFTEQIDLAASELVGRIKELIAEGNVRRLIIRNQDDEVLLEVPLTAGVAWCRWWPRCLLLWGRWRRCSRT